MKKKSRLVRRFQITVLCFLPISISVILLPICGTGEKTWQDILGKIVGILFWGGVLAGSYSYFLMCRKYKKQLAQTAAKRKIPAALRFFSNPAARVVDAVFLLSLAGSIYSLASSNVNVVVEFIFLFLFVTSCYLHFMVNGRIFQYIAQKRKEGVKK